MPVVLLFDTQITADKCDMSPGDAFVLGEALIYAAEQATEHQSICPIFIEGYFPLGGINVNPHKDLTKPIERITKQTMKKSLWKRILGFFHD